MKLKQVYLNLVDCLTVEHGSRCIDQSNGNDINFPKQLYYALGKFPVKGYKIYKYIPEQTGIKMVRNKNVGSRSRDKNMAWYDRFL